MKFLTALIAIVFSTNLFACPEIGGAFSCQQGSHISEKEITKNDTGYLINSDGIEFNYISDGKVYDVEATDTMKDGKVKSYCKDNKFIVEFKATILDEGSEIARQSSVTEYLPSGMNLLITQKTKMKGIPLPALKLKCTRL
ncbi:MAG: hypothetical protein WC635_17420 [Bacteriovorax sp.]|jgi:hypothetical protein